MGRLKALPPLLQSLPPGRLFVAGNSRERDKVRNQRPWRRWYHTAPWKALRWAVLVRDGFTCQRCGLIEARPSKLVADHKRPHRGDAALFWDEANLQTLCATCHSGAKQREEHATRP